MISIKTLNEDGYILVFVLIVTSILLMLGLTTITIAQTNYKMKKLNSQGKKNFYIVESLTEESEMKLYCYVEQALHDAYFAVSKNQDIKDRGNEITSILTYQKINKGFKDTYIEEIKKLKVKLEDTSKYNIKAVDGYKVMLDVVLEEFTQEDVFNLSIISTFKDKKIIEKIEVKYKVTIPEYTNYENNEQLIYKVDWKNYK